MENVAQRRRTLAQSLWVCSFAERIPCQRRRPRRMACGVPNQGASALGKGDDRGVGPMGCQTKGVDALDKGDDRGVGPVGAKPKAQVH